MVQQLQRFIYPPTFADPEKTRLAGLVHLITVVLVVLGGIYTFAAIANGRVGSFRYGIAVTIFCFVLASANRFGYPRTVGFVISIGLWIIFTLPHLTGESTGIVDNSFSAYMVPIIIAGFVVNSWLSLSLTAVSTLIGLIALINELNSPISMFARSDIISRWVSQGLAYLVTAMLVALATHSLQRTLERARQHEQDLAQRNQDLQTEISERTRIEEAYRTVVENSLQALFITQNGRVVFVNQAAIELFGYTREEMMSLPDSSEYLVHPDDLHWIRDYRIRRMAGEDVPSRYELRIQRKDGTYGWTESFSSLTTFQGKPAIHVALIDITDRKLREEQERELQREHERVELLTHLISDISHDLKNPLASIQTSLYLVEKHTDPFHRKQKLDNIKEQTVRLERLVRDLLTLSQLDSEAPTTPDTVDLNQVLQDIQQRLHVAGEQKNLRLSLELDSALPALRANEGELNRAFTNLVDNAITYTPGGGTVSIHAYKAEQKVVIEVKDTGMGIAPEQLPRLFERFYRADEARAVNQNGSGLGLAIVKKIVEKYSGNIEVESSSGQGTTFRVIFPDVVDVVRA